MADSEPAIFEQLLSEGLEPREVIEIAESAIRNFEANRKRPRSPDGAIGTTGVRIYQSMLRDADYEPDIAVFREFRPFTIEDTAQRVYMSRTAVGPAINRLIEHGFVIKLRDGRQFRIRLAIPRIAIAELGEDWSAQDAPPNSIIADFEVPMGRRLLKLFPRPGAPAEALPQP